MEEKEEKAPISIKEDWYQTESSVVITILIKNIDKDRTELSFTDKMLSAKLGLPNGQIHDRLFNLAHTVDPLQCSYKISPTKIEIKLKKVEGIRWNQLEGVGDIEEPKQIQQGPSTSGPPTYPTSKPGKNWTEIERDIIEADSKEKPVGEEALNKLFQDIYGRGDENVKKAMVKSFMESGGTVLSTNWNEISKERVEIKPPDGMEWKKWDS